MKLRIYIDGYNLYYGALKRTPYKWLDPIPLVRQVIKESAPPELLASANAAIVTKYFTSPVEPKVSFSQSAKRDQNAYIRALEALYPASELSVILGSHTKDIVRQRKVDPTRPKVLHQGCEIVEVWRIEEKQSDVAIAVEAMRDAYSDYSEQHMVFVSNDTDFLPLFQALRQLNHIHIGIIAPGRDKNRPAAKGLEPVTRWMRNYFTSEELKASQLPLCIEQHARQKALKQPIRKPIGWYGQHEFASKIFDLLLDATGKRHKVNHWLEQAPVVTCIDGLPDLPRPAIEMLDDIESAKLVLRHAEAYAQFLASKK